jgi:hypothetical protein
MKMKHLRLSEIAEIKFCVVSPGRTKTQEMTTMLLQCANFLRNNTVIYEATATNYAPDDELLIKKDDIVVKRISPMFVNYIDYIPNEMYAGNNLIVITPKQEVYSKYLAMQLNERIESLSESSSVGAVMKSVSRQHLEEVMIPLLPYEKQILVGDLWYSGIELEKMKSRLAELESQKRNYQIKKYVETFGGKYNG